MTGALQLWDGKTVTLPAMTGWELRYGAGVPCDAFRVQFPGDKGWQEALSKAVSFTAEENGQRVFTGLVDEVSLSWGEAGTLAELSGRGMAARLLDNEAPAQSYVSATAAQILRDHVTPFGVETAEPGALSAVPGFTVTGGSSRWSVLYQFARYYNGISPWFDRWGRLHLVPFSNEVSRTLDNTQPILGLTWREKRYGVLSRVLVQQRNRFTTAVVNNEAFLAQGGCAQQVLTMPTNTAYQALRYSGDYQLRASEQERYRLRAVLAGGFWGWPGELVQVNLPQAGVTGRWRIGEAVVELSRAGLTTELTLCRPAFG